MKAMTQQHLINAFGGESQTGMPCRRFAVKARKQMRPNVARLCEAIAFAEFA